jgi:hypothetical protein
MSLPAGAGRQASKQAITLRSSFLFAFLQRARQASKQVGGRQQAGTLQFYRYLCYRTCS